MTKILLMILLSMTATAGADGCRQFSGNYQIEVNCQGISPHSGLQIGYFAGNQELSLIYDPGTHPMQEQRYIADGQQHSGDGDNSGDTYTASCTADTITIRRVFRKLLYPIKDEIKMDSTGLDYVETFEGRDGATVCRFERL